MSLLKAKYNLHFQQKVSNTAQGVRAVKERRKHLSKWVKATVRNHKRSKARRMLSDLCMYASESPSSQGLSARYAL